jgi:hypothetical protein
VGQKCLIDQIIQILYDKALGRVKSLGCTCGNADFIPCRLPLAHFGKKAVKDCRIRSSISDDDDSSKPSNIRSWSSVIAAP